jgi:hypothetical protein
MCRPLRSRAAHTFRECAGCGLECAARKLNVPGVRMYVCAGLGLSRLRPRFPRCRSNAEVPHSETVEPPGIAIAAASDEDIGADGLMKNETRYTLVIDPDAPSAANPTSRQFRHWVVRASCIQSQVKIN